MAFYVASDAFVAAELKIKIYKSIAFNSFSLTKLVTSSMTNCRT